MISYRQRISYMLKTIEKIFEATDCSREDFMAFPVATRWSCNHTCPSMLGFVKSFCGISDFFDSSALCEKTVAA